MNDGHRQSKFALSLLTLLTVLRTNGNDIENNNNTALQLIFCKAHPADKLCQDTLNITDKSTLLNVKGYSMNVIYNRVPKTASEMLRRLFRDQAQRQHFSIKTKEIFVPFRLDPAVQQEVVEEVSYANVPFFYERHMYFLNFDAYKRPQPIYINIIRDPVNRVISEYYWSRQICREENRCYFDQKYINETLDDCVTLRSAGECVGISQGINTVIPFFCGHGADCAERNQFALNEAKQNIIEHYTVVGIVEELYNFLYVLERLLPRYFANVCLTYMSNGHTRQLDITQTSGQRPEPNETTKVILRKVLLDEYELYEFFKQRFYAQLQQILGVMSHT